MEGYKVKLQNLGARAMKAAARVVQWTAQDVRKTAKSSIKSGGKNRNSKTFRTSKPGEPPLSHTGRLKNAVRYRKLNGYAYAVGPDSATEVPGVLEHGGSGSSTATFYTEPYVRRMGRGRRASHGKVRPRAARPYTVVSRSGASMKVSEYKRFYSREAWDRARTSPGFAAWANAQREKLSWSYGISPRPYMKPALVKETAPAKIKARFDRAGRFKK